MHLICRSSRVGCVCLGLALVAGGCRSRSAMEFARIATPMPPAFLAGPAGVLLTNTTGFSAQVESQGESLAGSERLVRGQLVGAGPQLLFAPVRDKAAEKRGRGGNFVFVWNVAESRGYVLSDALQAYAPVSSDIRATNVVRKNATQTVDGISQWAVVQMNNGTADAFQVVPTPELNAFPQRVRSLSNAVPLTVTFSKVRPDKVAADLFEPPDGFAKYNSPEALVDELAARQRNLRRRPASDYEDIQRLLQERR